MSDYIRRLQAAILKMHGCEAKHVSTTPVIEVFNGEIVWEGEVETFSIRGHPRAWKCFAWGYQDKDGEYHATAVLGILPIWSPEAAVKAAIVAKVRNEKA